VFVSGFVESDPESVKSEFCAGELLRTVSQKRPESTHRFRIEIPRLHCWSLGFGNPKPYALIPQPQTLNYEPAP
jgi:hypothetical protein